MDKLNEKAPTVLLTYLAHTLTSIDRLSEMLNTIEERHQKAFEELGQLTEELKRRFGENSVVTFRGKSVTLKQIDDGEIWEQEKVEG